MSTTDTSTALPAYLASDVRTVATYVKRVDAWRAIYEASKTNPDPDAYDVRKMPTATAKRGAYGAARRINQELCRDRAHTVEELRATVDAARAALGPVATATSKAAGRAWADRVRTAGFTIRVGDHGGPGGVVVELRRTFTPGDSGAYVATEVEALSLISEAPIVASGTTWGTTSDGVGGHAGMAGGYVEIIRSGVSKRFASGAVR